MSVLACQDSNSPSVAEVFAKPQFLNNPIYPPQRHLKQLTGLENRPNSLVEGAFPDPSPPYVVSGKIQIYGTGPQFLQWDDWGTFLRGGSYQRVDLHNYALCSEQFGSAFAWDATIENWNGLEILYAGWLPEAYGFGANWIRRVTTFTRNQNGCWTVQGSLSTPSPDPNGSINWIGHSYGHQFVMNEDGTVYVDGTGKVWVSREQVTDSTSSPIKTEIFMSQMAAGQMQIASTSEGANNVKVISVAGGYPAMLRGDGTWMVEGPRTIKMNIGGSNFFVIAFSSGDWPYDGYTIALAYSSVITGPYTLILNDGGTDLKDFGKSIKMKYPFLSGVGRPALFKDPDQNWWMIFHAWDRRIGAADNARQIYLTPLTTSLVSSVPTFVIDTNLAPPEGNPTQGQFWTY